VLSLPRHHRVEDAARHIADLTATGYEPDERSPERTAGVPPFQPEELHALSYASVFHPWIVTRTSAGVRNVPAEGAMAGLIARRTIAAGAWASPGDQPLVGVVALDPVISTDGVVRLAREGVNVLMRPTRDFVARTGRTLSRDEAYAPLGVRRLMILLRRAALRHGSTYVFDPHGPRFRASVERTFETLLADLYQRGAFAGDVPSDAFRVVADSSVNPPREVDAGRFTVELRIAPSRPLVFLRVRLVEAGSGNLAVVEG
jgi:phage tail sheath protein FI